MGELCTYRYINIMHSHLKLAGNVAVVPGASRHIGAATPKRLAVPGAAVVVNYASSKEGAERVAA